MNNPPRIGDEVFFIGGGTYETSDYGSREYRNDVYALDLTALPSEVKMRCVSHGKGSALLKMMYHSMCAYDEKLWVMGGFNGSDQRKVFMSDDLGRTWFQMATPPWAARHAALLIPYNDKLYFGTGYVASDMWEFEAINFGPKDHLGSQPNTTTAWGSVYTVIDKSLELTPGVDVEKIGMFRNQSGSMNIKIARHLPGSDSFEFVVNEAVSHSGGYQNFTLSTPYTVPSDGYIYRPAVAFSSSGGDQFCTTPGASRWYKAGNLTGTQAMGSLKTDGAICMTWTET